MIKLPGNPRNKSHRHKYGQHYQGGADDGGGDLVHGFGGSITGRELFFFLHDPLHIFHHHDGIIHHQADGQDQREKGDGVGTESQNQKHRKAAHQGYGNGEGGNQGGAPVLKKKVGDPHHQQKRDQKRQYDIGNGGLDIACGVVAQPVLHAFGKTSGKPFNFGFHPLHRFQGIGAGGSVNGHIDGGGAVEYGFGCIGVGPQFHPRYVPESQDAAAWVAADHNIFKILDFVEATLCPQRVLHLLVGIARCRTDGAGSRLDVLLTDGGNDIVGGESQGG